MNHQIWSSVECLNEIWSKIVYTSNGVAWWWWSSIPSLGSKDQTSQMTLLQSMMEYWSNIPYLSRVPRLGGLLNHLNYFKT
jgi:hypothetical protein